MLFEVTGFGEPSCPSGSTGSIVTSFGYCVHTILSRVKYFTVLPNSAQKQFFAKFDTTFHGQVLHDLLVIIVDLEIKKSIVI